MTDINKLFNIKYNGVAPHSGKLLISQPLSRDLFFNRSVVLLAHNTVDDEHFGFILNKPLDITIDTIFEELTDLNASIHLGGPCEPDSIFFIHCLHDQIPHSKHIVGDLYWSANIKKVLELNNLGLINNHNIKFFIGYSGWQPEQLEAELKLNQWIISDMHNKLLWEIPYDLIWTQAVKTLSPDYDRWLTIPENPNFN